MTRGAQANWAPYLDHDERILWKGQPIQGWTLGKIDIFLIPFSAIWATAALGGVGAALGEATLAGAPFILIFVVVAFYLTVGRFMHDAWRRSRTHYAITDRRALILRGGTRLQSKGLARDVAVDLTAGARSTISIGEQPFVYGFPRGVDPFGMLKEFTFVRIEDGERVYRLIRQVQNGEAPT